MRWNAIAFSQDLGFEEGDKITIIRESEVSLPSMYLETQSQEYIKYSDYGAVSFVLLSQRMYPNSRK